jgi:RHS repeat-associated protein
MNLAYNPSADTSPMHFTGKQRDGESGLDFFRARYNESTVGRFMSPDPLLASARVSSPQTWNRYSYALNNPVTILDPNGLWDWSGSAGGAASDDELKQKSTNKDLSRKERNTAKHALKFRSEFRQALALAASARQSGALTPGQRAAVADAVRSYGTENDHNGVDVGVHNGGDPGVTEGLSGMMVDVSFSSDQHGNALAVTIAHEGVHVNDNMDSETFGTDITQYETEHDAWMVSSYAAQGLGMRSYPAGTGDEPFQKYQVWNKGWEAADVQTLRAKGVANVLDTFYSDSKNSYLPH